SSRWIHWHQHDHLSGGQRHRRWLPDGNANVEPDGITYGDAYANSNSDGGCFGYTYRHSHSDSYSHRHTVTHPDLRARWHTRTVGYCCGRATCSLSRWWMHRWNKYLRIRRW